MTNLDLLNLQDDLDYLLTCYRSVESLSFGREYEDEDDGAQVHVGRLLALCNNILAKLLKEFEEKRMQAVEEQRSAEKD